MGLLFVGLLFLTVLMFQPKEEVNEETFGLGGGVTLMPGFVNELYPSWLYYEVKPGETLTDKVYIRNGYDHIAELGIGALDLVDDSNFEEFQLKNQYEDEQVKVGKWIVFDEENRNIALEADEERFIEFTMTIPEDTALGNYYGAVYADYVPEGQDGAVVTVLKTGLRVILKVTDSPQEVNLTKRGGNIWDNLPYGYLSGIITLMALILILFSQTQQFAKWFSR